MPQKLRVGVIFGGRSGEHEVSLVSATSIIQALDPSKYEVVPIGITREGRWLSSPHMLRLMKERSGLNGTDEQYLLPEPGRRGLMSVEDKAQVVKELDVVFPIVHGTYGEDGTLQGLLELAGIPYVGAGVLGSALGMDKIVQKQLFQEAGLPIVKYLWVLSEEVRERPQAVIAKIGRSLRYPVFTKPANTGSSVGISKIHSRAELLRGLELAATFDRKVIIEQGVVNAREIECSVLGNNTPKASIPGEIVPSNEFYDYDAKYVDGKSKAIIPAELPRAIVRKLQATAVSAFTTLDLAGMARVDFFVVRKTNKIYLNEVNTLPGFTSISMYPKLWEASGIGYHELLDRLIALAIERHAEKAELRTVYDPKSAWYKEG